MPSKGKKRSTQLLLDGSNYESWRRYILSTLRAIDPVLVSIVDVSIVPPSFSWENYSNEQVLCLQRNALATNVMMSALSTGVLSMINREYDVPEDAHKLWKIIEEKFSKSTASQDLAASTVLVQPVQPVSHTGQTGVTRQRAVQPEKIERHRPNDESTSESKSSSSDGQSVCLMADEKKKELKEDESDDEDDDFEFENLDALCKKDKFKIMELMKRIMKQDELLERQEEFLIRKMEELEAQQEKNEKLTIKQVSLTNECKTIEEKLACTTNASSCVAKLEEENDDLKAQLEMLTSKHVMLQKSHEKLVCSHEQLQDAHAMLQVESEVVLTSVKLFQPLTQHCTCSHKSIDFTCANACCSTSQLSVEQVIVESCDDLIAKENDELKLEVKRLENAIVKLKGKAQVQPTQDNRDPTVKKLELGTTVTKAEPQQKKMPLHHKKQEVKNLDNIQCFKCHDMGHYAFMCSSKNKNKTRSPKSQARKSKAHRCYGCKEKGHLIMSCPNGLAGQSCPGQTGQTGFPYRSDRYRTSSTVPAIQKEKNVKGPIASRTRQALRKEILKQQDLIPKSKKRTCYTCRLKGHLSIDCPNGNTLEPKVINSAVQLHEMAKIVNGARKVICSPHVGSKTIWVPKPMLTNLVGPNKSWVPKST